MYVVIYIYIYIYIYPNQLVVARTFVRVNAYSLARSCVRE